MTRQYEDIVKLF